MGGLFSKRVLIANGYHQEIFGRVDMDKSTAVKCGATHLRLPSVIGGESQKELEENEITTNELFKEKFFTKIGAEFRACFPITRNGNSVGEATSSVVYVSIALANGDFICRGLQVVSGCIIIVDGKGNLKTANHSIGKKSSVAWKDFVVDVDDHDKMKKNI